MPASWSPRVLLTGGAGYIGSHTYLALCESGFVPVILDNFSNSVPTVLARLSELAGRPVPVEHGDVCDRAFIEEVLRKHEPEAVVHFAGLKSVSESIAHPLRYFRNNIAGAINVVDAMFDVSCMTKAPAFLFSSSATVYGEPSMLPIPETAPRSTTNPYGYTKLVIENMLQAVQEAHPEWRLGTLRYFNPVGAHPSGMIGEDPTGVPNNLMPYVARVAVGALPFVHVFGHDYPTKDGTGVRDYIHVQDLAAGHVAAVRALVSGEPSFAVNLGTGQGHSVLEVISAFEKASNSHIPYQLSRRRIGDVPECYADPTLARQLLGWEATRTLDDMCADTWRWQRMNPRGYRDH